LYLINEKEKEGKSKGSRNKEIRKDRVELSKIENTKAVEEIMKLM
jgi:hypothetical protein